MAKGNVYQGLTGTHQVHLRSLKLPTVTAPHYTRSYAYECW